MNQAKLKEYLNKVLLNKYGKDNVVNQEGFLYAKGEGILLTAHMDTVHKTTCKTVAIEDKDGKRVITSPQGIGGDDRCGIWLILKVLNETDYRPSILFCEDEEIGGIGSNLFTETPYIEDFNELKFLVELDRANENDAVFYDCGNKEFQDYITNTFGLKTAYGSFSDISHLSPACDKASINISCGYYKAHTLEEYVVIEEMENTFEIIKKILADVPNAKEYDYQEERYFYNYNFGWGNNFGWGKQQTYMEEYYYVAYLNKGEMVEEEIPGCVSMEEAVGLFLMKHSDMCYNDIIEIYTL